MSNQETDLEKLRDEKCIPVAKAILKDLAQDLIPEDANKKIDFTPAVKNILTKTLEADLNISTENSYIFQLILGVFAALNTTVQACDTVLIDDVRYGAISKKILDIVASADIRMGNVMPEEIVLDFIPVKEQINALFAAEKLSMLEVKYIMDNIFTSFKTVTDMFNHSVQISSEKAEAKMFKVESMSDLTMKRLDEVLKEEVK